MSQRIALRETMYESGPLSYKLGIGQQYQAFPLRGSRNDSVPRDRSKVCVGNVVADRPFFILRLSTLNTHALLDLLQVTLASARNLLRMKM